MRTKGKCDICGKEEVEVAVCCSIFGAYSLAYCRECFESGKESYNDMVAYIACAGRFPEDINEEYQEIVRDQLKLHNISEEQFIKDVKERIKNMFERGV
jgi:hypothetical protein